MGRQRAGASRPPVDDSTEAAERATLDEVLAELGGGAHEIVLFRQNPSKPTEWPYMGGFMADSFSLDSMKLEHGGGNYRARILAPGKKFKRQITFQIDGPPKAYPIAPAPAIPTAGAAPETVAILEALKAQTAAFQGLALELRAGQRAPASDPLEYGLKIAALVTQAGGKGGGQGLGISDMLDLLDRGMELAGNGDGGGYGTVVREFGKPLLELLQKMADRPTNPDPRRFRRNLPPPDAPAPQNGNVAEHIANPPGVPMGLPRWLAHLAPLIPHGLRLATMQLDPESFAPALYQVVPDSDLDDLNAAAADPHFSLAVLEAYPDTQQHREWFTRLLEAVRELILEGAKAEAEETAEPGGV